MHKLPFYVGNLAANLVPGSQRRTRVRAAVNLFFFRPQIRRAIREIFGERVKTIKFIRQHTLGRVVYLVNDKYFVKIFRDVSHSELKNFEFLNGYVADRLNVAMPRVIVPRRGSVYVCERISGRHIESFSPAEILKNAEKIQRQVFAIIDELQRIDVNKIPNKSRFMTSMQARTPEKPGPHREVLGHFDLNETNLFFDDDMNVCAVIDWDTLSIAQNPETDKQIFMKYWNRYLARIKQ